MSEPATYRVEFDARAFDEIMALPEKLQGRIFAATDKLEAKPRPSGVKKMKGSELYRVRVGSYRVVYRVQDDVLLVVVVEVGNRKEVYRKR
jgi:mRNA interferase RelE/StbE